MDALGHCYAVVRAMLLDEPLWDDRVFHSQAPAGTERPYVVYFRASGGADNFRRDNDDASFALTVKCVADTLVDAMQGASRISALLDDKGTQDVGDNVVPSVAGSDWVVTTITKTLRFEQAEETGSAELIHHQGHQFEIVMEEESS